MTFEFSRVLHVRSVWVPTSNAIVSRTDGEEVGSLTLSMFCL